MDIWRPGFVRASLAEVLDAGALDAFQPAWLTQEEPPYTFLADPFGIVGENYTYVFAERLDYRDRRGTIEVLKFDSLMRLMDRRTCISEPWHLSYPVPVHCNGEDYLLPEAHRSGGLHLYRAIEFPDRWERMARLDLPLSAIDATPMFYDGLWWLFHGRPHAPGGELHVAYAETLLGSWRMHPQSPVLIDPRGSRPAGQVATVRGKLVLPVQDCSRTYGGAVRPLWIERLDPDSFEGRLGETIQPPACLSPFIDGLHTLTACGDITLFDVKRIDRSLAGKLAGFRGKAVRAVQQSALLRAGTPRR